MFVGDYAGSGSMLPWVCDFGGLQIKIETVKMKEKKMKKKISDVEDEWEEDEKFGTKQNQIDEERVIFLQLSVLLGTKKMGR